MINLQLVELLVQMRATYVNAFTPIRETIFKTIMAKEMGYNPGRFSFNVKSGRCESCEGWWS